MLYRELVEFTPIETIIQLHESSKQDAAKDLVKTYEISEAMARKLNDLAFPQLQFDRASDNKGILIVGNYGTGKSHLMSVISAVAERAELTNLLTNTKVQESAKQIAGKFKVVRIEIGSVTRSLRDIILDEIQNALRSWGVDYQYSASNQLTNNKTILIESVAAFNEKYPDMGLLVVVDELLDYLSAREQHALILDLGFLRELGEVAKSCRFRFIAGLQESLFEAPRFSFVSEQLRRVRDRFEQITIAREDITYVVSQRLLKKTDAQKAKIREYLRKFAPLYKSMPERMDEFVNLFPIHPDYVEIFENLTIAEKRQVLKTFSVAIRDVLDMEVPVDQPGLISYDHYWKLIQDDPALRNIDDIAKVIEKSNILENLISNSYTRPNLKEMALRLIRALSVQRLTNLDVNSPLGVTAENLRDGLCLYLRLPPENKNADFLLDQVKVTLNEIIRTVQGQFIAHNHENEQYYLDITKSVDFDQKIHERGDAIDKVDLNMYFFDALRLALNLSDTTYLANYSIWFYELPWLGHNVMRPGYLFFGRPDERTTAQPPRDFYIFVLPPFLQQNWHDQQLADECIFHLTGLDDEFEAKIRLYAGARAMANESTEYRTQYANLSDAAFRNLMGWLREHAIEKLNVIFEGVDQPIKSILSQLRTTAIPSLEDLIRNVSAHLLQPEFEDRYPEYPKFTRLSQVVSENSRSTTAMEAIRSLCGRASQLGNAVLEGFGILDANGVIRPGNSTFAQHFLKRLQDLPEAQVVNRGDVIEEISAGLVPVEKDTHFKLEPEWVVVLLVALAYNGDIVLHLLNNEDIDASKVERVITHAMADLVNFRFYKRPKSIPMNSWISIFNGLGLPEGLLRDENTRERAVSELQSLVRVELDQVVKLIAQLEQGSRLWNTSIFSDRPTFVVEAGTVVGSDAPEVALSITDLLPGLRGYKQFLETLTIYKTVGMLNNLQLTQAQILEHLEYRSVVQRAHQLLDAVAQLQPLTSYLVEAQGNLPDEHPWVARAHQFQNTTLEALRKFGKGTQPFDVQQTLREINTLKTEYKHEYSIIHHDLVLTASSDDRRQRLQRDARYLTLHALSAIDLLAHSGDFSVIQQQLGGLIACRNFHDAVLDDSPTCPFCHLRPATQPATGNAEALLQRVDERLSQVLADWRAALVDNLSSATAQTSLAAMAPTERKPIEQFLKQPADAEDLPQGFVAAATQALHGIRAVTFNIELLVQALKAGGLPCTREELQSRFIQFLDVQMRGHDAGNTRLTLGE